MLEAEFLHVSVVLQQVDALRNADAERRLAAFVQQDAVQVVYAYEPLFRVGDVGCTIVSRYLNIFWQLCVDAALLLFLDAETVGIQVVNAALAASVDSETVESGSRNVEQG